MWYLRGQHGPQLNLLGFQTAIQWQLQNTELEMKTMRRQILLGENQQNKQNLSICTAPITFIFQEVPFCLFLLVPAGKTRSPPSAWKPVRFWKSQGISLEMPPVFSPFMSVANIPLTRAHVALKQWEWFGVPHTNVCPISGKPQPPRPKLCQGHRGEAFWPFLLWVRVVCLSLPAKCFT